VEGSTSEESVVEGVGEQFRVMEGVGDALGGAGVLEMR
jgi:hypothetical protein